MEKLVSAIATVLAIAGLWLVLSAMHRSGNSGTVVMERRADLSGANAVTLAQHLTPDMNPLRLTIHAGVQKDRVRDLRFGKENYNVELKLDGRRVKAWHFELDGLGGGKEPVSSAGAAVEPIEVKTKGNYVFEFRRHETMARPAFRGHSMELRRNVEPVESKRVWHGAFLILAAALLQWLFGAPLSKNEAP